MAGDLKPSGQQAKLRMLGDRRARVVVSIATGSPSGSPVAIGNLQEVTGQRAARASLEPRGDLETLRCRDHERTPAGGIGVLLAEARSDPEAVDASRPAGSSMPSPSRSEIFGVSPPCDSRLQPDVGCRALGLDTTFRTQTLPI